MRISRVAGIGIVVAVALLAGCKAKPAKDAGFVDSQQMKKDPTLPFQKTWEKPGVDRAKYKRIYIAPVNTAYMLKNTDWQKGEIQKKEDIERDVAKLGVYATDQLKKAFREDKQHRFEVVDALPSSPDALILELALIEVVPSKVTLNALGYAPFFIGTGVTVFRAITNDVSSAAFEARLRDAGSGEIVALYADREQEQAAIVSVRGLTWYSHAETMIRQWSQQFVQVLSRKPGQKVKDTDPFTLQPW